MPQIGTRELAALISALLFAAMTGCSNSEPEAVPELPERICWGVFTENEIAPLMPVGKKAEMHADAFVFDEDRRDSATCSLYIDGRHGMLVNAVILDFEDEVDWSSWDVAKPQPIDVGKKGLIWRGGAGTHLACEEPKSPEPGKYIQMHISTDRSPDKEKLQAALPGLLRQLVTFAKRELNCP
ncbi:hypothetical protein [Streptomyces kurssanovii]|uniref:DUF3558 domain-containing protein n=1 Tax=Streptomyces kurssanovii TaxID=67312 RepID=A0ABV3HU09_9ACTN